MSFLGLEGRRFLVFGVANKKSIAYQTAEVLRREGATVVYSVRSEARRDGLLKLLGATDPEIHVCDVEHPGAIARLAGEVRARAGGAKLSGLLHAIAFANYAPSATPRLPPFHETPRDAFLQAVQISCHSLIEIAQAFLEDLAPDASVVTVSISTTIMAAENYGYMAPIKAALESSAVFLAKSFAAAGTPIRVNAVCPGLLKTSASAGIPGYVDSYLFAEQATLRKRAVETREVADTIAFLLSPRSSGINAQKIVIDAGMGSNYFDRAIVEKVTRP